MSGIFENYIKPFFEGGLKIFRLIPFMIVSYYLISAVFAGNFKMFILFVGLIFSTLFVVALSRASYTTIYGNMPLTAVVDKIKSFSIFNFGVTPMSLLPLSLNIYAFLLSYYLYVLFAEKEEDTWTQNWGIIATLGILLVLDITYFRFIFKENAALAIMIPLFIGMGLGAIWPMLIGKSNWAIAIADTNATCGPTSTTYKCNLTTDGTLLK